MFIYYYILLHTIQLNPATTKIDFELLLHHFLTVFLLLMQLFHWTEVTIFCYCINTFLNSGILDRDFWYGQLNRPSVVFCYVLVHHSQSWTDYYHNRFISVRSGQNTTLHEATRYILIYFLTQDHLWNAMPSGRRWVHTKPLHHVNGE